MQDANSSAAHGPQDSLRSTIVDRGTTYHSNSPIVDPGRAQTPEIGSRCNYTTDDNCGFGRPLDRPNFGGIEGPPPSPRFLGVYRDWLDGVRLNRAVLRFVVSQGTEIEVRITAEQLVHLIDEASAVLRLVIGDRLKEATR